METTSPDAKIRSYGPKFKYIEFKATSGKFSSLVLSLGLAFSAICLMFPPVSTTLTALWPRSHHSGSDPLALQTSYPRGGFRTNRAVRPPLTVTAHVSNARADNCGTASSKSPTSRPLSQRPPSRERTSEPCSAGRATRATRLPLVRLLPLLPPDARLTDDDNVIAVMVAEAALTILLDRGELPEVAREGGVLTPASALGDAFVQRLEATGRFTIQSEVVLGQGDESRKTR